MDNILFPTDYNKVIERIEAVNPVRYAKTRNFIDGDISYLSPYIARGVISLPKIAQIVLKKYTRFEAEKFLQELAWREYFQRVWQAKSDAIFSDLKQEQSQVDHHQIPTAIIHANTGIQGIDHAINSMYQRGYMHNHARMYTAMLSCNIAKAHWLMPAKWMYYHLLDGDLASNMLSWQWVAGAFSSKKYYANQENINRYTNSLQTSTYIDCAYENFPLTTIPDSLSATTDFSLQTTLPPSDEIIIEKGNKIFVYNAYNIDPLWHKEENGYRILLLEPALFKKFPVSEKVIDFIIEIARKNIPNIQILVAPFNTLLSLTDESLIYFKEHPLTHHYKGICESRDWLCPSVTGYFPSFFSFWKKIQYKF
jgi:deoxyribodipyrimidine photo-lyase